MRRRMGDGRTEIASSSQARENVIRRTGSFVEEE